MIQLRREGEVRWRSERREIRDVELKEVIGSSGPVGGKAVKSLLICACSTECMFSCVYLLYIVLCVCFSVHQIWVYVQAHLNV